MESEFEELKNLRLWNWGRYGRQDECMPAGYTECICAQFIANKNWDQAWGDPEAVPEPILPPINERDGEFLDGFIKQLRKRHRAIIKLHYYHEHLQRWERLDEAVRALLDAINDNRRAIRRMKELGA